MGLDVDLVKFNKAFYDANKNREGKVDYNVGHKEYELLAEWRKHYDVRDFLSRRCGTEHESCTFGELSRLDLKKVLRQAMRQKEDDIYLVCQKEMKALIPVLRKVLHQTNFKTETVALSWIG